MTITDQREIAQTAFRRNPKRDEINEALKQEHARREAAVKNLYRLRARRLARDAKNNNRLSVPLNECPNPKNHQEHNERG
jgi:hypothetical protein